MAKKPPKILVRIVKIVLLSGLLLLAPSSLFSNDQTYLTQREKRVVYAGEKLGMVQGISFGSFCINDITKNYKVNSSLKLFLISSTTLTINYFVGAKLGNITSRRIVSTSPDPLNAMGQGAIYGAIDGAIIGSISYISMLSLGYLTDTFEFNPDQSYGDLTKNGILVGTYLGGTVGLVWGIYGITLSLYIGY